MVCGSARKTIGLVPQPDRQTAGRVARKEKSTPVNAFFQELFRYNIYKRTQGRIARQVTFAAIAVCLVAGLWQLSNSMIGRGPEWSFALPAGLLLVGLWITYRLVNVPGVADFLIAVEAEMNKVSWPTRNELYRSSVVVLVTIFVLAMILFVFDFFWGWVFKLVGIL